MDEEENATEKRRRGRPRTNPVPQHLTMTQELSSALDAWIARQPRRLSRPEAIRLFMSEALYQQTKLHEPAESPASASDPNPELARGSEKELYQANPPEPVEGIPAASGAAPELARAGEADAMLLAQLRRVTDRLAALHEDQREIGARLGIIEQQNASISTRIDRLEARTDTTPRARDPGDA
jgi:hypothetical protein